MRVRGLILALPFMTATAASAQTAGSAEITGFSRYSRFDNTLQLDNRFGGGGSLGFFVLSNLAVEAEGAYIYRAPTTDGLASVTSLAIRGRVSYNLPLGGNATAVRIGAGYVRNLYRKDVRFNDNGFTGIFGLRLGFGPTLGLRMDGTADYVRSPDAGRAKYVNWGGQAGLSLVFGNSHSSRKDKDKDGVPDKFDRCPKTPAGMNVDSAGCARSQRDSDGDRVNDETDRCPNTPSGAAVDADGCSLTQNDADHDGVSNTADRCPRTPAGERVNLEGCSDSQRDDDGDGVLNNADRCPASRAGERVDPNGCAIGPQDSDQDGVVDTADQCPNTPRGEPVNPRGCTRETDRAGVADGKDHCGSAPVAEKIDENGCPILFKRGARSVILQGVAFETGRAMLTPEGRDVLRAIASQLVDNPGYRVQISGHTDNIGSRAANLRLSLARARTVETFLVAYGVPPRQVTAKGFGPDVPIAPNTTAAGRAQNRRVELNRTN